MNMSFTEIAHANKIMNGDLNVYPAFTNSRRFIFEQLCYILLLMKSGEYGNVLFKYRHLFGPT